MRRLLTTLPSDREIKAGTKMYFDMKYGVYKRDASGKATKEVERLYEQIRVGQAKAHIDGDPSNTVLVSLLYMPELKLLHIQQVPSKECTKCGFLNGIGNKTQCNGKVDGKRCDQKFDRVKDEETGKWDSIGYQLITYQFSNRPGNKLAGYDNRVDDIMEAMISAYEDPSMKIRFSEYSLMPNLSEEEQARHISIFEEVAKIMNDGIAKKDLRKYVKNIEDVLKQTDAETEELKSRVQTED